jgi:hypothetical protein
VRQLFSILNAVCQILEVKQGFGKHQVFVDLPSTMNGLRVCLTGSFVRMLLLLKPHHSTYISASYATASVSPLSRSPS